MNRIGVHEAVQLLVNVSVLAGIVMLAYELHQNRQFARHQFIEDQKSEFLEFERSMMSSEMASVWIKAVSDPASLELSEIRMLDAYLLSHFKTWMSLWRLELEGFNAAGSTKRGLEADVPFYLGSTFGKVWWQDLTRWHTDPDVKRLDAMVDEILADTGPSFGLEWLQSIQRQVAEKATDE